MAAQKLTRDEAITQLVTTRTLSTGLLEPLGLPFESFLSYAQKSKEVREKVMDDLIAYYTGDDETKRRLIREAQEAIAAKS